MRLSSRPLGLLACGAALGTTTVHAASGTVEVDLLFPQNDTYTPEHIIPVAFAIQNSELAAYLQPSIAFNVFSYSNSSKSIADGYYDLSGANLSSSDPYMQYGEALEVLNTEGTWILEWVVSVTNCSTSGNLEVGIDSTRHRLVFTTKNGAKKPDLAAATDKDTCFNAQGYALKVTETRDSGYQLENGQPCAVLAETAPSPSPCGVNIDTTAAANVSASLTDRACAVATATWCPQPDEGAAQRLVASRAVISGVALLAATFSWLGFLLI